jgi:hopanoid biosynthesis associated protein HpnK
MYKSAKVRADERFLIVTADDFGLHQAVNEAVEQANRAGVLSAASLMMGSPATADAVRRARRLPRLRVGLHIVLADGTATLAPELIPALADSNGRMNGRMFVNSVRFVLRPSIRRQLEAEIRAQFAAFAKTGLEFDHVNVHKHFHMHPTLLGMILRIGRDYGRPAMRIPDEPLWVALHERRWSSAAGGLLLKPWTALMRQRVRAAAVASNDAVFGIAASGAMTETALLAVVQRLPAGVSEIYLHPATEQGAEIAPSMTGYRHVDEYMALMSPRVRAAIGAARCGCGGYSDIPQTLRTRAARESAPVPPQRCRVAVSGMQDTRNEQLTEAERDPHFPREEGSGLRADHQAAGSAHGVPDADDEDPAW